LAIWLAALPGIACLGVPITPSAAVASSTHSTYTGAVYLINAGGLSDTPPGPEIARLHSNNATESMWLSAQLVGDNTLTSQFVAFDLGAVYDLTGVYLWNYNQDDHGGTLDLSDRGVQQFSIQVSDDADLTSAIWTGLAGGPTCTAPRAPAAAFENNPPYYNEPAHLVSFAAEDVRLVRLNVLSNYGSLGWVGLSEVRFEGALVPEPAALLLAGVGLAAAMGMRLPRGRRWRVSPLVHL